MSNAMWGLAHFSLMFSITALAYSLGMGYLITRHPSRKTLLLAFILSGVVLLCVGLWALYIAYNHGWLQPPY